MPLCFIMVSVSVDAATKRAVYNLEQQRFAIKRPKKIVPTMYAIKPALVNSDLDNALCFRRKENNYRILRHLIKMPPEKY